MQTCLGGISRPAEDLLDNLLRLHARGFEALPVQGRPEGFFFRKHRPGLQMLSREVLHQYALKLERHAEPGCRKQREKREVERRSDG